MTQLSFWQRWRQRFMANHASISEKCAADTGALLLLAIAGLMIVLDWLKIPAASIRAYLLQPLIIYCRADVIPGDKSTIPITSNLIRRNTRKHCF